MSPKAFWANCRERKNGGPDHEILEQIFEELRDWEIQLKHADIDWDELDDPGLDDPDLGL